MDACVCVCVKEEESMKFNSYMCIHVLKVQNITQRVKITFLL